MTMQDQLPPLAAERESPPVPPPAPRKLRLGEELPIFCEKCGYALHGLPQNRCAACDILQFHCPECGHHQPINTLRPAFHKFLGRMRMISLVMLILFKLNFFIWLLVAWCAMGVEFSYNTRADQVRTVVTMPGGGQRITTNWNYTRVPADIRWEDMFAFFCFALPFGMFARMLLLRWRRGYLIGLVLAALVAAAIALGAHLESIGRTVERNAFTPDFMMCIALAATTAILGASIVWGAWAALVTLFLPRDTGRALLDWQAGLSNRSAAKLGRD